MINGVSLHTKVVMKFPKEVPVVVVGYSNFAPPPALQANIFF